MSAAESNGFHSLNSFAALLDQKFQTSLESSKQNTQLKKMADENAQKRVQKGGKKKDLDTAFKISDEIKSGYATPAEPEIEKQKKLRLQKIKRYWAKEWLSYRYVTRRYMIAFAVKPSLKELGIKKRPPPEEGVVPNSTSIRCGDEFPVEWEEHLGKLKKQEAKKLQRQLLCLQIPRLVQFLQSVSRS